MLERADCALDDRWVLTSLIAEGNLTTVYGARPAGKTNVQADAFAVKVLRKRWETWEHAVRMIRQEYRVGMAVQHSHLVTIFEGNVEGPYYTVMPRLRGKTLAHAIDDRTVFSLPVILWMMRQAVEALEALHAEGWMHGDVKLENLLVTSEGHVTLLDLGFAHRPEEEPCSTDRYIGGTIGYLAPELLIKGNAVDITADIYSLGIAFYRLLTGHMPYEATTLAELASLHRREQPDNLRRVAPHVPPGIASLVHRMIAKTPMRRPSTPSELVKELVGLEISTFGQAMET